MVGYDLRGGQLLKLCELADGDGPALLISVARYVIIVRAIDEQPDTVFTAEANQFRERRLNRLGVFESYDDVRVDQELETVHR
jgi:hypothetical protein